MSALTGGEHASVIIRAIDDDALLCKVPPMTENSDRALNLSIVTAFVTAFGILTALVLLLVRMQIRYLALV